MPETPHSLFVDLDEGKTRFRYPSRPIFLCGGAIRTDDGATCPSLRDYLYRVRKIEIKLPSKIVLAERANQLFVETDYKSLIRFEEDIALLSGLVILVAEGPGSLAELGSFEANRTIRRSLRVLIQDSFERDQSFIRNGPIRQLEQENEASVAYYPWRTNSVGSVIKSSIKDEVQSICEYISEEYQKIPFSHGLSGSHAKKRFLFCLYWIIHLCGGALKSTIYEIFKTIFPSAKDSDIRNGLFCLELLGWIGRVHYGPREYVFALHDDDPFLYRFKKSVANTNATARKNDAFVWIESTYPVERGAKKRILRERRKLLA